MDCFTEEPIEKSMLARKANKLEPLKQWYCDSCGEVINQAKDGHLQWIKDNVYEKSFVIVHNKKDCLYDEGVYRKRKETVADLPLSDYVGIDGLLLLLDHMETKKTKDNKELVEIIARIQVPYYEEGRRSMDEEDCGDSIERRARILKSITNISKRN